MGQSIAVRVIFCNLQQANEKPLKWFRGKKENCIVWRKHIICFLNMHKDIKEDQLKQLHEQKIIDWGCKNQFNRKLVDKINYSAEIIPIYKMCIFGQFNTSPN